MVYKDIIMIKNFLLISLLLTCSVFAGLSPTTSKISGDSTKKTTSDYEFPNFSGTHAGTKVTIDGVTSLSVSGDLTFSAPQLNSIKIGQEASRQMATGVIDGSLLSINVDPTKFNLSAQVLSFSDYSSSLENPVVKSINCPAQTAVPVTSIATADSTYVSVSPSCTIIQSTAFPTQVQRRTNAFIGRLSHVNRTSVTAVASLPDLVVGSNSQLYDLYDAIGPFNISGNVISPNGANLSFNRSAGSIFRRSANYPSSKQNPHVVSFSGATASNFFRSTQTATNPTPVNVIDVANYDVAGTVTAIPGVGGTSTNRRVYIFSTGAIAIQYGQVTYGSLANAIAGIATESFVVNPQLSEGGVLLAIISCRKDATNLSNTAQCKITKTGRFDQTGVTVGSLSTATLNQAYDNSVSPQITTSSTGGSVDIKRGSAADTDNVLTAQNGAGSTTWSVKGTGEVKSLSKISADNVFRDSNLLTNPSFENSTIGTGWTFVNGSCNSSSGVAVDGSVNCSFTSTGANWSASQCSTTNAARLAGQEMENSVWLGSASTTDPIWVCPGTNGSYPTPSVSNGCMQYTNIGNIQLLKNYFLGDSASTSNCIRISGSNPGTTVGIDKAYTGLRTNSEVSGQLNTPWSDCGITASDFQGFGTVSSVSLQCMRIGPNLLMRGAFIPGNTTAVQARINLKFNGQSLNTSNSTYIPALQKAGDFSFGAQAASYGSVLVAPSLSYITMGIQSATKAGIVNANGNDIANSGVLVSLNASIPISGWENNINAFSLKCDNPRQCETLFAADISSTGVITNQTSGASFPWLSSCTNATTPVCTFVTGVFPNSPPLCWHSTPTGTLISRTTVGATTVYGEISNTGGTPVSGDRRYFCRKTGLDAELARITQQIVQMREVPRTPGATRTDIFAVSYGTTNATTACSASPCSYLNQIGNAVTSITRSGTGQYVLNLSKTYTKLKCTNSLMISTASPGNGSDLNCSSSASCSFITGTSGIGTRNDTYGTINCIGEY